MATALAAVNAVLKERVVFPAKRGFCAFLAHDVIGLGAELSLPLGFGLAQLIAPGFGSFHCVGVLRLTGGPQRG